eukprot:36318_1
MTTLDLRKADRIGARYKKIVFGYIREAQTLFSSNNTFFNIVDLIKYICLLYYYNPVESSILTDEEIYDFLQLLQKNNKGLHNYEWKLIYKATETDITKKKCIEQIYGKPNLVCLFHDISGNICGGYTLSGWSVDKNETMTTSYHYGCNLSSDSKAFIFSIKSNNGNVYKPTLYSIAPDCINGALRYSSQQFCTFGKNFTLFLEGTFIYCNNTTNFIDCPKDYYLLGKKHGEKIQMIEIFQLE